MAQKKQILIIDGMHCTSCSLLIDGDLEDTQGVISAKTYYAQQITEVVYNDEQIVVTEILEVVKKTGYTAVLR